jgi:hypothetical protein
MDYNRGSSKDVSERVMINDESVSKELGEESSDETRNDGDVTLRGLHEHDSHAEHVSIIPCDGCSTSYESIGRELRDHVVVLKKIVGDEVE